MASDLQKNIRKSIENANSEQALEQSFPDTWMADWTKGFCQAADACPGPNCLECRKSNALKVLSSPASRRVASTIHSAATVGRNIFGR